MTRIERLTVCILPHALVGSAIVLFAFVLMIACSGCGTPPAASETDQITDECAAALDVVFACTLPEHEVTEADREKCHEGAVEAVATPGCVEVAHEEIACIESFFASYGQCAPATPTNAQVYQDLRDYAALHCPSLLTPETAALHCPDFT